MDFQDILKEYRIPYHTEGHEHCRVGWLQIDCPFCGKDSERFHMGYSLEYKYANCWRCGQHNLISVLCELLGIPSGKAKELIKDIDTQRIKRQRIRGKLEYPVGTGRLIRPHLRYLRKRGFSPKEIKRLWDVQGIAVSPTHAWRLLIPVYFHGAPVSWTTRSISSNPETQRYLHARPQQETMNRTEVLYGEDYCRGAVIICEGPFDVWKIGPGAVALLGLNYSSKQIERMIRYPIRAVCFDNEKAAQHKAEELVDLLSLYPGKTYNIQLDSQDAGSATTKEIKQIRKLLK